MGAKLFWVHVFCIVIFFSLVGYTMFFQAALKVSSRITDVSSGSLGTSGEEISGASFLLLVQLFVNGIHIDFASTEVTSMAFEIFTAKVLAMHDPE